MVRTERGCTVQCSCTPSNPQPTLTTPSLVQIIYNRRTSLYVMAFHLDTPGFALPSVGFASSPLLQGPFTWRHWMQPDGRASYDMTLFQVLCTGLQPAFGETAIDTGAGARGGHHYSLGRSTHGWGLLHGWAFRHVEDCVICNQDGPFFLFKSCNTRYSGPAGTQAGACVNAAMMQGVRCTG